MTRAIDGLVNVDLGDQKPPDWMVRVKEDYFKAGDSFFKSPELPELLEPDTGIAAVHMVLLPRPVSRPVTLQCYI